jgi:hypothetical protein
MIHLPRFRAGKEEREDTHGDVQEGNIAVSSKWKAWEGRTEG